ncbi:MAG: DUF2088 domain-containing protein [Chloroflexota bacterium]
MNLFDQIQNIEFPAPLPSSILRVKQTFEGPKVTDIPADTYSAVDQISAGMKAGESVAVGVGSRGIANLPAVVRSAIDRLKEKGLKPYIVPTMGSHGGATAEGQLDVLNNLGVTPERMGVEFRASMEVKEIGAVEDGPILYQDANAHEADHAILVSRIKPHTDFRSHLESGPSKMCVIGFGKQFGAAIMHRGGVPAFQKYLAPAARVYEQSTNFAGAICLVENGYDETAIIQGLTAAEVGLEPEAKLLEIAKELMASIPFPAIDVLVIKQIGKDISGGGMDPNVTGRLMIPREPENFKGPDLAVITVLDLTEATHGNATGIGFADVTTARLAQKIDWQVMYMNGITSGIFGCRRNHLPITMPSDKQAMETSLRVCGQPQETARMAFIQDTLNLEHMWISPSLRQVAEEHPRVEVLEELPLQFNAEGVLEAPWNLNGGSSNGSH